MGYVFISYSSKDSAKADRIRSLLKDWGFETWMAPGDIPAGQKYAQCIVSAIRDCACFLLLLTESTQQSTWVPKEVERAVSFKRPIVPVALEDVVLNDEFSLYISTEQAVRVNGLFLNDEGMQRALASVTAYIDASDAPAQNGAPEKPGSERVTENRPFEFDLDDDVLADDELDDTERSLLGLQGGTNLLRIFNSIVSAAVYPLLVAAVYGFCVEKEFGIFLTTVMLLLPGALMSGLIWLEMHGSFISSIFRYDKIGVAKAWLVTMSIGLLIGLVIGFFNKPSDVPVLRVIIPIVTTFGCGLVSLAPAFDPVVHGLIADDDDYVDFDD